MRYFSNNEQTHLHWSAWPILAMALFGLAVTVSGLFGNQTARKLMKDSTKSSPRFPRERRPLDTSRPIHPATLLGGSVADEIKRIEGVPHPRRLHGLPELKDNADTKNNAHANVPDIGILPPKSPKTKHSKHFPTTTVESDKEIKQ